MKWLGGALPALALALCIAGSDKAADNELPPELYRAEAIVTGKEEPERTRGFRVGLAEIAVKLTGRPELASSKEIAPLLSEPAAYIQEFSYEDRMKHLPIRDEQGTRDRPHFLRIKANPEKLEAALKKAGFEIWRNRPDIEVLLIVNSPRGAFLVGEEAPAGEKIAAAFLGYRVASERYDGYEQREVLKSIARRRGFKIVLPDAAALGQGQGQGGEPSALRRLFHLDARGKNAIRYRAELSPEPSGYWRLDVRAWGSSLNTDAAGSPDCFSFLAGNETFDIALQNSLDAAAAWARSKANANVCGLP